jgi:hypothetical protein
MSNARDAAVATRPDGDQLWGSCEFHWTAPWFEWLVERTGLFARSQRGVPPSRAPGSYGTRPLRRRRVLSGPRESGGSSEEGCRGSTVALMRRRRW